MWAKAQGKKFSDIFGLHRLIFEKDENFLLYCTSHIILHTSSYFQGIRKTLRKPYLFEAKITEFCFKKSSDLYVDRDLIWKGLVLDHYLTLITSRSTFNAYCCKILCAYICCNKINFWVDFLLQSSPALANTARYLRQGCLFRFNRAYKKILLPKWIQQFAEKTPE